VSINGLYHFKILSPFIFPGSMRGVPVLVLAFPSTLLFIEKNPWCKMARRLGFMPFTADRVVFLTRRVAGPASFRPMRVLKCRGSLHVVANSGCDLLTRTTASRIGITLRPGNTSTPGFDVG
jgi:hypothetical protein